MPYSCKSVFLCALQLHPHDASARQHITNIIIKAIYTIGLHYFHFHLHYTYLHVGFDSILGGLRFISPFVCGRKQTHFKCKCLNTYRPPRIAMRYCSMVIPNAAGAYITANAQKSDSKGQQQHVCALLLFHMNENIKITHFNRQNRNDMV